jgi:MICOS complex subunit MIC19
VQARVAEELKKLSAKESAALKTALEKASEIVDNESKETNSRQAVSKEVETLRARLDKRKQLRELPDSVETARSNVVKCLIANDRRPLDCWKEVEDFKEEVRRLEKSWVDRVVR